jgi:TPR repeat protein
MSSEEEAAVAVEDICCACCGKAEVDDVKLKMCGGCDLVKYCSDECLKNHREQHEEECKKRKAELRDRDLFEVPDGSCYGECPICCLPLSLDESKSAFMSCCCQTICNGCGIANQKREFRAGLDQRCVFCREPLPKSEEEPQKRIMERVKKNDPVATRFMGNERYKEGDYDGAVEYLRKAAELGDALAHYHLSIIYHFGDGVEKDEDKEVYHLEEAAIRGHPRARYILGNVEVDNGRFERAKNHYIIAANLGDHDSLQELMALYKHGLAGKEDYADALSAHQAAVDATKSSERERAEEAMKCNDDCQENHREQHEEECNERNAELCDKDLFTQPDESHLGECPICCLPLPLEGSKSAFMECCSKWICTGCDFANQKREHAVGLDPRCAFCREPAPESTKEWDKRIMKRVKKNDPAAMWRLGTKLYDEGDYGAAFKYLTKAAELGDAAAHGCLGELYGEGEGVEKDEKKQVYHLGKAAIGGHPEARHNLGCSEVNNGRFERAKKHWIIAASLGHDESLRKLRILYAEGVASKEEYAGALRAYQAAVDATKSSERKKAEEAIKNGEVQRSF